MEHPDTPVRAAAGVDTMKPINRLETLPGAPGGQQERSLPVWVWPVVGGGLTAVVVGGMTGIILGVLLAAGLRVAMVANAVAAQRRGLRRDSAALPLALDVTAASLTAGAPLAQALAAAAAVTGGELGRRLGRTSRALRLGEPVLEAFEPLTGIVGAERVAVAVHRSHRTGSALTKGLADVASRLRDDQAIEAVAAAHRVGVWLVLPLCLCFLPAFMLAGLIPVVLSVLDSALTTH